MTELGTSTNTLTIAYQGVRRQVAGLLADPPRPQVPVPHCPQWCVEDVVQHLVEVCARVGARESGADSPAVTARGFVELLQAWDSLSPPVDAYLAQEWTVDRGKLVMDAFTHELDLRDALGAALPPVDHPALQAATHVVMLGMTFSLRGHGMAALRFETELGGWTAGDGQPVATATGTWIDVYLSLTGRRTPDQIESRLDWSGDVKPFLPSFTWGPFTVPVG